MHWRSSRRTVLGSTSYHDILPAIKRVEIGYTWYAKRCHRTHVNTTCKLLLLTLAFETLGCHVVGWRTDNYSWHWVFLINVPIGIAALLGVMASVPKDDVRLGRFDWRGFVLLAMGIAALQLMLDRGNEKDWFDAFEIQLYLVLAFLGFYWYWVHWRSSERTFVNLGLLRDRARELIAVLPPERLAELPPEQPLPKEKPQEPRRS